MSTDTSISTTDYGVEDCDPGLPAPAVVLTNSKEMRSPGHGYTLPLVGRQRPHTFEVVLPEQQLRIFADRPEDVLAHLITDYAGHEQRLTEAIAANQEKAAREHELAAFAVRSRHATQVRQLLQQRINADAHEGGTWSGLDDEDQQQLEAAAAGQVPTGVLLMAPAEDDLGNPAEEEVAEWSAAVPLVLNRGEYIDGDVREPESGLETEMPDGRRVVVVVQHPENLVVLDPTDPYSYLTSLHRAGFVTVKEREYVAVDDLYEAVMAQVTEPQV
ncbi:hypothetical protein [Streptomyces goshikiensis]|uniref:hypothetical protein n=1 Tax=Streptomyces goshikiensis TaxID=1942 RepID=UPI0036867DC3